MTYGYHRTSTKEQHLDRGIHEIEAYCTANGIRLERIYTDQQTGKNFNRPRYTVMKEDVLRSGDTLIVTELDRLGRNKAATLEELRQLKGMGVRVMVLEIPTTLMKFENMGNEMAKMMLETINNMLIEMYASMAHAEMEKKEKRQREGIDEMKARGEWGKYGRPAVETPSNFTEVVRRWRAGEITAVAAMRETNLSKPTFYRKVKEVDHATV